MITFEGKNVIRLAEEELKTYVLLETICALKSLIKEDKNPIIEEKVKLLEATGIPKGTVELAMMIAKAIDNNENMVHIDPVKFPAYANVGDLRITKSLDDNSAFVAPTDEGEPFRININILLSENFRLASIIHELTHMRQHLGKMTNGDSITNSSKRYGYPQLIRNMDKRFTPNLDDNSRKISDLFYAIFGAEVDANISTIVGMAKLDILQDEKLIRDIKNGKYSPQDVYKVIRRDAETSDRWMDLEYVIQRINEISKMSGNEPEAISMLKTINNATNNRFKNFKEFSKYLLKRSSEIKERLKKVQDKVIYQVWHEVYNDLRPKKSYEKRWDSIK